MKTRLALVLLGVSVATAPLRAQAPTAVQYAPGALEQLVAPIALYPDPLIALILPAASASTDVVLAARYLEQNGDPAQIDAQPWDPSVKSLAHYPDLTSWMSTNLAWTQALGQAYSSQPAAVMQAIQTMRAKALAAGSLQSTPQQQVVQAANVIEIVPVEPSVIYVPYYDWNVVYDACPVWDYPLVTFRLCYPIGPWLHFGLDWREHRIWSHAWRGHWDDRPDRGGRNDWADRRDGDRRDNRGGPRDRGSVVAGPMARPPSVTHNQPGLRAVDSPPRGGTTPPRFVNGQPRNSSPPPRFVNSPPRAPATRPNFPAWNSPRSGPNPNEVHAFPRAPIPNRAPAQSFAQNNPPRTFGGRSDGGRPAYQASPRPSFQSPAPRAPAPQADRGDSGHRQGRAAR